MAALTQAQQAQQLAQANALARQLITQQAIIRKNQIATGTVVPGNNPVITVPFQNVGLVLGFYVVISAIGQATATAPTGLTEFGPANVLSQVQLNDLANNTRIQTSGRHLHLVNTVKNHRPFGVARTNTSYPIAYGANFPGQMEAPATPSSSNTTPLYMTYWVPCAYSRFDLRGAIYANVFNATANLTLTINPTPFSASGDSINAIWYGNAGSLTSLTYTVYQVYYDQLPVGGNGGVILPATDLGVAYMLNETTITGMVTATDFPYTYANFRDFLSTFAMYDNGTTSGALGNGSDINYWQLQSANFTNIWKLSPALAALEARNLLGDDLPAGVYYFDTRDKPISSYQFGNMQLVMNPNGTVNAGANLKVGVEQFAQINQVVGSASLQAG